MNLNLFAAPRDIQEIDDWPFIPRRCPSLPDRFDYHDRDAVSAWIYGLKPIETSDIANIEIAMWNQLKRNAGQLQGARQILAIDGEAALGKTVAVTTALLRIHDVLLESPPPPAIPGANQRPRPVIYIADQGGSFVNFLKAIAFFVETPYKIDSKRNADDLLRHLAQFLPSRGTKLIVVDDAHMLRRVGAARDLTDNLKRAVDRLPVSFVFVGAGLESSALLKTSGDSNEYSAAEQIARRMKLLQLAPLTTKTLQKAWRNRVDNLVIEIERIPGWNWSTLREHDFRQNLYSFTQGSTGRSFELIKDTIVLAVNQGQDPTTEHLLYVARKLANK